MKRTSVAPTIVIKGGLGNQLFFVNLSRIVSELTGQKNLLDLSWYKSGNRENELTDSLYCLARGEPSEARRKVLFPRKIMELSGPGELQELINTHGTRVRFEGFYQQSKLISPSFLSDLYTVIMSYENALFENLEFIFRESTTLLHLRLGDFLVDKKFGVVNDDYLREAIRYLQPERLVIITDSPQKVEMFPTLGGATVLPTEHWSGISLLRLAMNFTKFIGSNSTLSWWISTLLSCRGDVSTLPVSRINCKCCLSKQLSSLGPIEFDIHGKTL